MVTAQSSKGLEFQAVVVIGVGGLDDDREQVVDQTRLLYVAMTRAKDRLMVAAGRENKYSRKFGELARVS